MSDKMTWEEIIVQIRKDPAYKELVEKAYFEEDLPLNVERFQTSPEFVETMKELKQLSGEPRGKKLLDIGAGNGIASIAFALEGYEVTAIEPDPSLTIGSGAIRKLEEHYRTNRVNVIESFGEQLPVEEASQDVVYIRQAMHHAHRLDDFIREAARVLKKGGWLFTVRDHVIYNEQDKKWFLDCHPLHKFYGGENAFTFEEYEGAMRKAGLKIARVLRHYDSVINYFPETPESIAEKIAEREQLVNSSLRKKLPAFLANRSWVKKQYAERLEKKMGKVPDEKRIAGRMITFFAQKR